MESRLSGYNYILIHLYNYTFIPRQILSRDNIVSDFTLQEIAKACFLISQIRLTIADQYKIDALKHPKIGFIRSYFYMLSKLISNISQ